VEEPCAFAFDVDAVPPDCPDAGAVVGFGVVSDCMFAVLADFLRSSSDNLMFDVEAESFAILMLEDLRSSFAMTAPHLYCAQFCSF
jgi:hypothetical protein